MSCLVSRVSDRDTYRPVRPFRLVGITLSLVAVLNITSATAMLLSLQEGVANPLWGTPGLPRLLPCRAGV